jgi:hypothetical protein
MLNGAYQKAEEQPSRKQEKHSFPTLLFSALRITNSDQQEFVGFHQG